MTGHDEMNTLTLDLCIVQINTVVFLTTARRGPTCIQTLNYTMVVIGARGAVPSKVLR